MNYSVRKCRYEDLDYILKLKELCLKWYIEIIYGWDTKIQREKTLQELNEHLNDMRIITVNGKDVGVTTFYEEDNNYVIGLIMIHPNFQNKGLATKIIKEYLDIARSNNKRITIKTYKENPAQILYKRLGFKTYNEDNTHIYLEVI